MSRLPSVNSQHRDSTQTLHWVTLPAEHDVVAPDLPDWRSWHEETRGWWARTWKRPQAAMWESSGESLHPAAVLVDEMVRNGTPPTAELRAYLNAHGLGGPKSLTLLRWRLPESAPELDAETKLRVLRALGGD